MLFHGLEGDVDSPYMVGMSVKAHRVGWHSVRVNHRNCGGSEHLARGFYHAGRTEDPRAVLEQVAAAGAAPLLVCGVSLGGNMLLKLLAEYGGEPPPWLAGAVAISPSIDLTRGARALRQGFNRVYEARFLLQLKAKALAKARAVPDWQALAEAVGQLGAVRSLYDFDDRVVAPCNGFRDAPDYYARCSAGPLLGAIRVPTLVIHAQDDPFVPYAAWEASDAWRSNLALSTLFPPHGGHVGFVASYRPPGAAPWMDERWAENQAIAFLGSLLDSP